MPVALTGKTRYRTQTRWFGKPLLVLQVEERYRDDSGLCAHYGQPYWRDATAEDITTQPKEKEDGPRNPER